MNLNGQCKSAFEEYFLLRSRTGVCLVKSNKIKVGESITEWFYSLPHSMQHGVKVKFFDSVGIHITVFCRNSVWFEVDLKTIKEHITTHDYIETREEAETKAEQKANDYYNENN